MIGEDRRRIPRREARYEVANDRYAKETVLAIPNEVFLMGPRLQMPTHDPVADCVFEKGSSGRAKSTGVTRPAPLLGDLFLVVVPCVSNCSRYSCQQCEWEATR
ncbi:MAG: hypothetical protein C4547_01385 [Phycisphaerales bacterium]|nr:MAG: hypothetical protein C4547_01385 [Phycisphaerales bacterium]